jgi:hypothetical protein
MPAPLYRPQPIRSRPAARRRLGCLFPPARRQCASRGCIPAAFPAPKYAPRKTLAGTVRVGNPALTNPIVATVTAQEDCTREVMTAPEAMPRAGLRVQSPRMSRSASPAASRSPSVIIFMASRNRPTPPARVPAVVIMAVETTVSSRAAGGCVARRADPARVYIRPASPMPCGIGSGCLSSPIIASVVIIRPATEAAFCSATRTTLVGSIMPISIMSPYSAVWAL